MGHVIYEKQVMIVEYLLYLSRIYNNILWGITQGHLHSYFSWVRTGIFMLLSHKGKHTHHIIQMVHTCTGNGFPIKLKGLCDLYYYRGNMDACINGQYAHRNAMVVFSEVN